LLPTKNILLLLANSIASKTNGGCYILAQLLRIIKGAQLLQRQLQMIQFSYKINSVYFQCNKLLFLSTLVPKREYNLLPKETVYASNETDINFHHHCFPQSTFFSRIGRGEESRRRQEAGQREGEHAGMDLGALNKAMKQ
jgi:hypothetical protein